MCRFSISTCWSCARWTGLPIGWAGILTELELEPDQRITEQVCIGESCARCLHACPADAVLHWGIDKRNCAEEAQEFGFAQILKFFDHMIDHPEQDKMR